MESRARKRALLKELTKIQKKAKKKRYTCLYPGCKKYACLCHSQQKEGQLRAIARNGKVYALSRDTLKPFTKENTEEVIELSEIGISNASTFPGFCNDHDNSLFKILEERALDSNNDEQVFYLFLRSFIYEYCQKRKVYNWHTMLLDNASDLFPQEGLESLQIWREGIKRFIEYDSPYYLDAIFDGVQNKDCSVVQYEWHVISSNVGASSSCMISPLRDGHIDYMRRNFDQPQPVMSFSLIPEETKSHVILSWLNKDNTLVGWVNEYLESNNGIENLINDLAFSESEDTCINPDLWELATQEEKNNVTHCMRHSMFRGPVDSAPKLLKVT